MASQLELELKKLKNAIIKISNLAENQVIEAMKALLSEPVAQGKEVKKTENKIDKLDVKIDEICQSIFASSKIGVPTCSTTCDKKMADLPETTSLNSEAKILTLFDAGLLKTNSITKLKRGQNKNH